VTLLPTPFWHWQGQDLILAIHVQPGASREGMAGLHGERLKIRIAAPASDGQANRRLLGWLAAQMDLPISRLELLQGAGSRAKRIRIRAAPATLERRLQSWSQLR
jgi:uncharacterized protein (TIGR00251 family)